MYNEKHSHLPWHSKILASLWGVQLFILAISVIILAILVAIISSGPPSTVKDGSSTYTVTETVQGWDIATLVITSGSLLLTCIEIQLFLHQDLTPPILLGSTSIKLIAMTGALAYTLSRMGTKWFMTTLNKVYLGVGSGLAGLIILVLLATLIYAIMAWKKWRRNGKQLLERYAYQSESLRGEYS